MLSPLERRGWIAAHDSLLDCSPADLALRRAQREVDRQRYEADRRLHRWQDLSPANKAKLEARRAEREQNECIAEEAAMETAEAENEIIIRERRAILDDVSLSPDERQARLDANTT